jgi:fused signal recognition particle receptor
LAELAIWLVAGGAAAVSALGLWAWRRRATARSGDAASAPAPTTPARSIRDGLAATRRRLGGQLQGLFRGGGDRAIVFAELEEILIGADVGIEASARLVGRLRAAMGSDSRAEGLEEALRREIVQAFPRARRSAGVVGPRVVLMTGVNGVGKTTTIGKLAAAAIGRGERVLLVAADTYRAAAIEQLEAWGARLGIDVVRHAAGASTAAVAFGGVTAARARDVDVVLVDTAGRLHTRAPLMEELRKVRGSSGRCARAPRTRPCWSSMPRPGRTRSGRPRRSWRRSK